MIDLFKINGLSTNKFVSLQPYGLNYFLLLEKLPVMGVTTDWEFFNHLPIGKLYDISCASVFIGNMFEIPKSYRVNCQSNYLACFKKMEEYKGIKSIMSNERFTCFTDELKQSMLVVNNKQHLVDIDKY